MIYVGSVVSEMLFKAKFLEDHLRKVHGFRDVNQGFSIISSGLHFMQWTEAIRGTLVENNLRNITLASGA